jgi:glycosyltransferase involved in cell wall biosynthesis
MGSKMKLSYLVTVKDESEEIKKLIPYLLSKKEVEDEIVVLQDIENPNKENEIYRYLMELDLLSKIFDSGDLKYFNYQLNEDFASFKNYGKSKCLGDYIFQIDADEIPSAYFLENLKTILTMNEDIELYWLPRINIVNGLTDEWVKRWGWRLSNLDEYNDIVNWPDYQSRLFKNQKNINWIGKVHEVLTGAETYSYLPAEIEYAIYHEKQIEKQIKQNEHYSRIVR